MDDVLQKMEPADSDEGKFGENAGQKFCGQSVMAERAKRVGGINGAFAALRQQIPTFPYEKRLSKIDTLNLACAYINMLEELLSTEEHPADFLERSIRNARYGGRDQHTVWGTSDLLSRLEWINWAAMGIRMPQQEEDGIPPTSSNEEF